MSLLLVSALLSVHPIHPGLSDVHSAAVEPVLSRAREELDTVVSKLKPHSVVATAAYGSWFLPVVAVGGDLDVLGFVDLGVLPPNEPGEAAVQRIEALLVGLGQRGGRADASLALLAVEGLDGTFRLQHRARAVELIERAAKGASNVAYPLAGRQVPYAFPAGVVSLPLHPRAKYISNRFALDPAKRANVREVSMQFFFTARVGERPLILQPLYGRAAAPIELWRFVLEAVFADVRQRARFAKVARGGFDEVGRRAEYGAFMLMVADLEIAGGRAVKAVKRLAQAYLAVAPALDAQTRRSFPAEAAGWLVGPAAAYDDLAAVAKIHSKAVAAGAEAALRKTGDVARVVDGYIARMKKLGAEGLVTTLARVHTDPRAWSEVAKKAKAMALGAAPEGARLRDWSMRFHEFFTRAGVRMVPVQGLQGQSVVVRAADLGGARPPVWPLPPWKVEVRDVAGADPVRRIYVQERSAPGWPRLRDALKATPLKW